MTGTLDRFLDYFPLHITLLLLASFFWLLSLLWVARSPREVTPPHEAAHNGGAAWRDRRILLGLWLVAVLLRVPGWLAPPRHSDDMYRYLWDGAVQRAGLSPYAGPPEDPIYAALRQEHADLFAHINNRHLPTIYPPFAQIAFRAASALGDVLPGSSPFRGWKLLVGVADLLTLYLIIGLCRGAGIDVRWAAAWGFAPLCAVELAQNTHLDGLGILPLCAALRLFQLETRQLETRQLEPPAGKLLRPRWLLPACQGLLLGVAILVKPIAAAALPALFIRSSRRIALVCGLLLSVTCFVPYLAAGSKITGSLGEYGRRWRSNDGAFALVQGGTDRLVGRLYHPPFYEPWKRPALARLVTGRDRDTVWPDELSGFLARIIALAVVLIVLLRCLRLGLCPARSALLIIGSYLLFTPTLHPWYPLWMLALSPLPACLPMTKTPSRSAAAPIATVTFAGLATPWLLLSALSPLAYVPLGPFLRTHDSIHPIWPRVLQHGACWLSLLILALVLRPCAAAPPMRRWLGLWPDHDEDIN